MTSDNEVPPDVVLRCIKCGVQPLAAMPSEDHPVINHPHRATVFYTHGHYGSTVFDEMSGRYLEITVCDPCLVEAGTDQRVLIVEVQRPAPSERDYRFWQDRD